MKYCSSLLQGRIQSNCMSILWRMAPEVTDVQCAEGLALIVAIWGSMSKTFTSADPLSILANTALKTSQAATSWITTSVGVIRAACNISALRRWQAVVRIHCEGWTPVAPVHCLWQSWQGQGQLEEARGKYPLSWKLYIHLQILPTNLLL